MAETTLKVCTCCVEKSISWFCSNCDSEVVCNQRRMDDLLKKDEDHYRREGYQKAQSYCQPQIDSWRNDYFNLRSENKRLWRIIKKPQKKVGHIFLSLDTDAMVIIETNDLTVIEGLPNVFKRSTVLIGYL